MIRRLPATSAHGVAQVQQNHRTGGYTVTVAGGPIYETDTPAEAQDIIAYLQSFNAPQPQRPTQRPVTQEDADAICG